MESTYDNTQYLSTDNQNLVLKETKSNLIKHSIYGLLTGLTIYSLTRRKLPAILGFSCFIGKSLSESNKLLQSKLQRLNEA